MTLVSQQVLDPPHLVGVVHPDWWSEQENGGLQQVQVLVKHLVLQQQHEEE